mgnify:FL=1
MYLYQILVIFARYKTKSMKKENIDLQILLPEKMTLQTGKYRIVSHLSSGGFGNTYEVMNVEFEERMALKEFFMKGISQRDDDNTTVSVSNTLNKEQFDAQKEKFKKEARRLRKLHNPHIVQVHDLFEENGTAYYAMDFVDGESLSTRLKRTKKPLSEAEAMGILNQILDALEEVHEQGIWHLDLKPGNIMVGTDGVAKLIDFGASKQMSASDGYTTTTTAMCYTPGYAPPEQIDQKMELIGPWTDLYGLGGTLYNLLTNNQPPTVSEMQEDDAFVYPKSVSAKTRYLIRWMMAPRRQQRPQSVTEVRDFLMKPFAESKAEDNDEETVFVPHKKVSKPKHVIPNDEKKPSVNIKWIGIVVATLLVAGVLFFILKPNGEENSAGGDAIENAVEQVKEVAAKTVTDRYFKSALGVCSYTGPVDDDGNPNGAGEASFTDGRQYKGPFVSGEMEGDNAYFRYGNGDTFEGSFVNNSFSRGRYTIKDDGSYFIGTFKNGQPDQGQWYDKQGKRID